MRNDSSTKAARPKQKIIFFGNFGTGNFGNEATLQAIQFNLHRLMPDAELACICTFPATAAVMHNITSFSIRPPAITAWTPKNRLSRLLRAVIFGIPSEVYRLYIAFLTLKDTDALIIPGTGLLTDAHGLVSWGGPYGVFKWSVLAKARRCKLLYVSVGAGPINRRLSRHLVNWALGLADFRSYRDATSLEYLKDIGFAAANDRVYPDLAFSLPQFVMSTDHQERRLRRVVGLGLMTREGMYGRYGPSISIYQNYMSSLVALVKWLLDHQYDIRLLIGQLGDPVTEFRGLLDERLPAYDSSRILDTPVTTVQGLLSQFAETDFVVATRFHNVLFGILNKKPTVSISFHPKCTSLMNAMGLSEYCIPIGRVTPGDLIGKVLDIERNFDKLKSSIAVRNEAMRDALEEQYKYIVFSYIAAKLESAPKEGPTSCS